MNKQIKILNRFFNKIKTDLIYREKFKVKGVVMPDKVISDFINSFNELNCYNQHSTLVNFDQLYRLIPDEKHYRQKYTEAQLQYFNCPYDKGYYRLELVKAVIVKDYETLNQFKAHTDHFKTFLAYLNSNNSSLTVRQVKAAINAITLYSVSNKLASIDEVKKCFDNISRPKKYFKGALLYSLNTQIYLMDKVLEIYKDNHEAQHKANFS